MDVKSSIEVHETLAELLAQEAFELVDLELEELNPGQLSYDVLMTLLNITVAQKDKLPSRAEFVERCQYVLIKDLGIEGAKTFLGEHWL